MRSTSQLERNPQIPAKPRGKPRILPSTQDEALSHCSVSREIPRSLLKLETVLNTLHETPEVPRLTRPHSRGTLSFPAHLNLSPFAPPHLEMRVDSPASSGKECWGPHHLSRGSRSQIETGEEPGGLATIQKTQISPSARDKA